MSYALVQSAKLAALVAAAPLLAGAGASAPIEQRLLDAHNRERAELGLPLLAWDDQLGASARAWATHLAETGKFEHFRDDGDEPQGENLWAGTRDYYSPEDMVGLWIAERRNYREGVFPNNSRTGRLADVGHYTQVIWADTRKVGCAIAENAREEVLVCRYSVAGNVIGQRPA